MIRWVSRLCFVCLGSALGQTGSHDPVIRISVNLVQVDAVVTDSSGRQVRNLTADDFEILEDRRPQKITSFDYVSIGEPHPERTRPAVPFPTLGARPPVAPPSFTMKLAPQQVQRTIVLMVDDLGLSFESTVRVRRALKKFVDEQMQDGDLVAVIRTRAGMGALEQFTSDKRMLYAAIDHIRFYPAGGLSASAIPALGGDALSNAAQMRMGGRGNGVERNVDPKLPGEFLVRHSQRDQFRNSSTAGVAGT